MARQIYQLSINETNPFLWNTPGQRRVALGADALKFIVTGADNTALGDSALESHLSGINNTAAGSSALFNSTNGAQNTAVGATALFNLQTGTDNTAIGFGALSTLVSGNYNTVVGSSALNAATGIENVGIGETAGANLGIGSRNVLVGRTADVSTDTSSNAVVVGHTAKTGELGVSIGAGAGTGLNFASTRNTLVGANTRSTTGVKTNASAIGWRAEISGDNQMIFGSNVTHYLFRNLLYGFPSAAATDISFLRNDGAGTLDWSTNANNLGATNLSVYNNVIFNGSIVSNFNRDLNWTNDGTILRTVITNPVPPLRAGMAVGGASGSSGIPMSDFWLATNVGMGSVGFGSNVLSRGKWGSVLGGELNEIGTNARASVIVGGHRNWIDTNAHTSFIGGGGLNRIRPAAGTDVGGIASVICGGTNNIIQYGFNGSGGAFIGAGGDNTVHSNYCAIVSGFGNLTSGNYSFMGAGLNNRVGASGTFAGQVVGAAVIAGEQNLITQGQNAFIGSGFKNGIGGSAVTADFGFVGGGASNNIAPTGTSPNTPYATIGGGADNNINGGGSHSFIGGGNLNNASETNAVIAGGQNNLIGGIAGGAPNAMILGGKDNNINGFGTGNFLIGNSNVTQTNFVGILGWGVTNTTTPRAIIIAPDKVATMTMFTTSNLTVRTSFATVPDAIVTLTADNQVVDATLRTHIRLASDSAVAGDRTFLLTGTNVTSGAHAILEWTGTNAGELVDDSANSGAGNIRLSATWTPTQYDTLSLIFNGTDWIETARATN